MTGARLLAAVALMLVGCGHPLVEKILAPKGTSVTVNVYTCPAPAPPVPAH
jgi:hypothetical protein